jgi:hypothetical protein
MTIAMQSLTFLLDIETNLAVLCFEMNAVVVMVLAFETTPCGRMRLRE